MNKNLKAILEAVLAVVLIPVYFVLFVLAIPVAAIAAVLAIGVFLIVRVMGIVFALFDIIDDRLFEEKLKSLRKWRKKSEE